MLFSQGAEARLYRCCYLGREAVLKERFSKKYRHTELDRRLTKDRIKNEFRSILKCKQVGDHVSFTFSFNFLLFQIGIDVPTVYFLNSETNSIIFEYVEGVTAKDFIERARTEQNKESFEVCCLLINFNFLLEYNAFAGPEHR